MSNPEKSGMQGEFPPPGHHAQQESGLLSSQQHDFAPPQGHHQSPQELPASGLLPTQQDYPPPPPGPPPSEQYQQGFTHQSGQPSSGQQDLPPQYTGPPTGTYPAEKQQHSQPSTGTQPPQYTGPPAGGVPAEKQQHSQPPVGVHSSENQQNFPPPPPGPPPAQEPHPNPLNANPVNPEKHDHSERAAERSSEQNYSIPAYDPAHPTFAPPPTNAAQTNVPQTNVHTNDPHTSEVKPGHSTTAAQTTVPVDSHKKAGWGERFSQLGMKAAGPINSLAHKLGSQSFLPETMDKECDKAASILTAFCKKGTYADPSSKDIPTSTDPKATEKSEGIIDPTKEKPKSRVLVTIPSKVISKAVGLAVFTTLRAGFQVSGAIGSGILIARLPDGSWGPPSGIQVNTLGGGFLVGLDIYDCVCVINNKEALAAFARTRVSLGGDLAVVAGPYGAGGVVELGAGMEDKANSKKDAKLEKKDELPPAEGSDNLKPEKDRKNHRRSLSANSFKPVFSYVKSRGFYAGLQVDGTVVVERKDANAAFYGDKVSVQKILSGDIPSQGPPGMWPAGARNLIDTLKSIDAHALKGKAPEAMPQAAPRSDPAPAFRYQDQPPSYVDDGVQRPGVGDNKYQYQ